MGLHFQFKLKWLFYKKKPTTTNSCQFDCILYRLPGTSSGKTILSTGSLEPSTFKCLSGSAGRWGVNMAAPFNDSIPHGGGERADGGQSRSPCEVAQDLMVLLLLVFVTQSCKASGTFHWKPTLQLRLLPEVIKALEAPRVLQCQLVAKVPEDERHEDDEESDGGQKAQHLWRD